ncbi:dihydrofolate reductase [Aeromonas phage AS-yj]|uniref:dihydrofolate reductase n=4 Tax=Ceceduovirus TaxID=2842588 RepID=A0A291LEX8_9CAUD|nr:dihydrofolate reductase [Aeromonas phage AS-zj]YP_009835065.1 dihydrofolate reductase [Aeromonas phage AS-sw]ATI17575.1 dihydrofolate reductase [Aeromonas phage AS-szw]ATI17933.1 dihydrofolate reductase [Aeromonas phage AS-yj]ASU00421.1 dihydrofolate reductase [Aeromonas phage AS-zj]ATI18413.1 dihydrofolate reductase [Aeromonas phage AS-sw]
MISLVFAVGEQGQFGHCGTMPWPHIREDMQKFKDVTSKKVLIMGRGTFESLPSKLKDRMHIVLSSNPDSVTKSGEGPDVISDDMGLINQMIEDNPETDFCVIGGPSMLYHFMSSGMVDEAHVTVISCATMPSKQFCDVNLDMGLVKEISSTMCIMDSQVLTTKEGLSVVYTHFKKFKKESK